MTHYSIVWDTRNKSADLIIIVPCYNADKYLRDCLENIRSVAQCDEAHILLIDDGSARPVHQSLKFSDVGVVVLRSEQNRGLIAALNAGLSFVCQETYSYAARQDADDISYEGRFLKQIAALRTSGAALCASGFLMISEDGQVLARRPAPRGVRATRRALDFRNPFAHSSFMFKVDCIPSLGEYSNKHRYAEDYDLVLRADRQGLLVSIPDCLVGYRINQNGISSDRIAQARADIKVALSHPRFDMFYFLGLLKKVVLLGVGRKNITLLQRILHK